MASLQQNGAGRHVRGRCAPHDHDRRSGCLRDRLRLVRGSPSGEEHHHIAIVAIGRNEASRLERCLDAALREGVPLLYVDSGSTDGSQAIARGLGVQVLELDPGTPFTAARARNEGMAEMLARMPHLELLQFLDGDCELVAGWISRGSSALASGPRLAAVCGRVRERDRHRSVYNLLCDVEWAALGADERSCGGNAMFRVSALREVGGFDSSLIAGEEAELCIRLRADGWTVSRLPHEMVLHDAAMLRFRQWWRRALRAGWAYAEGAALHGGSARGHGLRENASIFFWGAALPVVAVAAAWSTRGASLLLLAGHVGLAARVHRRSARMGMTSRVAALYAFFTVLGKVPQAIGQAQFVLLRLFGRRRRVVDWRTVA
jgi:GT2 family glycosyltransferase